MRVGRMGREEEHKEKKLMRKRERMGKDGMME